MKRIGWKGILCICGAAICFMGVIGCGHSRGEEDIESRNSEGSQGGREDGSGNGENGLKAVDLMEDVEVDMPVNGVSAEAGLDESKTMALADFSVQLFGQCVEEGKNALVSPLSVFCALVMTANGAGGDTLAQMEDVLGGDIRGWNDYLRLYFGRLPAGDGYKMTVANSVWLRDDGKLEVEPDFLQVNDAYYGAEVFRAAFDDFTAGEINGWIDEHTDGMIKGILDKIPEEAVLYLVNAIVFDAEWQSVYMDYAVREGIFTREDGTAQNVEMMDSSEYRYLEDGQARGFLKSYKGGEYAFAALLPDEGVSVADYVKSLTGERLLDMLKNPEKVRVNAAIPKFENEDDIEMSDLLKKMGIEDAFDVRQADFTGIGSYPEQNLFINRVLHKTFIGISEQGTRAGAVTAVEAAAGAVEEPGEIKEVRLDRPFVYMVVDCETGLPVFMGVEASVQ